MHAPRLRSTRRRPPRSRTAPRPADLAAEAVRAERGRIAGIGTAVEAARALLPAERVAALRAEAVECG